MVDMQLYEEVSRWFDAHKEDMIQDIKRLVAIPSVSLSNQVMSSSDEASDTGNNSFEEAICQNLEPFGVACHDCMDEMLAIGREHGFYTENYGYYVGSIGKSDKNWDNMIGFWNHLDVVPAGNHWINNPFEPVVKEHFLIGRGAQDNKGPAIGILYMMQCLRELQIPMKHELCLFVGCDEERGMEDLEYYTAHYPTPKMSMIADSGFPVCYGEKGIVEGRMLAGNKLSDVVLDCAGGSASNMIPDAAYIVLQRSDELEAAIESTMKSAAEQSVNAEVGETENIAVEVTENHIRVAAKGRSKHSAFPEGSVNAIHELMKFMAGIEGIPESDCKIFEAVAELSEEFYGEHVGIAYEDEVSGRTTCAATVLKLQEGHISLHFNIRYAITQRSEEFLKQMGQTAEKYCMRWELERDSAPSYFPKEHPAVQILADIYNEITGETKESFVMGGGTYARKLPNAFAYGIGGMKQTEEDEEAKARLFPAGHGGAHEPDEALNLRLFQEAMKIYTMAVIGLNDCEI